MQKTLIKNPRRGKMKGIILSGGHGTRLKPLTDVTSKQLLPVYNKPMIFYPLEKLLQAGIKEIMIIVAPDHCGDYVRVLGSGKKFGKDVRLSYEVQDNPNGLADAYNLADTFIGDDPSLMILGDNLFDYDLSKSVKEFKSGGKIFVKEVSDPERFGVVKFDKNMKAVKIVEKPKAFLSNFAITGVYMFDSRVVDIVKHIKPSERGELEITEIQKWYLKKGELTVEHLKGEWIDAGTFESYHQAFNWAYENAHKNSMSTKVKVA